MDCQPPCRSSLKAGEESPGNTEHCTAETAGAKAKSPGYGKCHRNQTGGWIKIENIRIFNFKSILVKQNAFDPPPKGERVR